MTAYLNTVTIKRLVDIIVIILIILVIRKRKIKLSRKGRRNLLIGIVILVIFLETGISLLEMKFLTFKNLRWAFAYNFPEYKLKESIIVDDTGFIILDNNDQLYVMSYEVKNGRWKYKNTFYRNFTGTFHNNYVISVNTNSERNIYLILVTYSCSDVTTISDNYDSEFINLKYKSLCYQYTTLKNPKNDYFIMFGENKYSVRL